MTHAGHGAMSSPEMKHGEHEGPMEMRSLPLGESAAWMLGTLALMLVAAWLTTSVAPISFSR